MMRVTSRFTVASRARRAPVLLAGMAALLLPWSLGQEASAHEISVPSRLDFALPGPGTYVLHPIMPAPDGIVLDSDGKARRLADYVTGKVTLLSFIYTTCSDAQGCPLALAVLHGLKATIEKTPAYRDRVRFVSLSFDPEHDTPQVMRRYGGAQAGSAKAMQWHFLTTRSVKELLPLLDGFGQDVSVATDPKTGQAPRALTHVLKLFLLDRKGMVREIYTPSFLLPPMMLNDIKTLLLEDGVRAE